MAAKETPAKTVFTTTEAADRLRVPPVLLRWVCATTGFGRERSGHQMLLSAQSVLEIDAHLWALDPAGVFRVRSAAARRARRAARQPNPTPAPGGR